MAAMEEMRRQMSVLADEINAIRGEIVQSKQAHATLHQSSVEDRTQVGARFADVENKLENLRKMGGVEGSAGKFAKEQFLIEPKQVVVPEFAGAVTDSRSKFLEWSEKVRDRVKLYSQAAVDALVTD